jgi:hypothetical protein
MWIEREDLDMRTMNTYVVAAATAVVLSAAGGYAQNAVQHEHPTPPAAQAPAMNHQAMMANMQAEQKKLDELVTQMNAASGPDKMDKIVAVVNELAAREKRMNSMMMMMHGGTTPMPHEGHH